VYAKECMGLCFVRVCVRGRVGACETHSSEVIEQSMAMSGTISSGVRRTWKKILVRRGEKSRIYSGETSIVYTDDKNLMMMKRALSMTIERALRQGCILFKRTCIFSGIQFTKHFIEFVFFPKNAFFPKKLGLAYTVFGLSYGHSGNELHRLHRLHKAEPKF